MIWLSLNPHHLPSGLLCFLSSCPVVPLWFQFWCGWVLSMAVPPSGPYFGCIWGRQVRKTKNTEWFKSDFTAIGLVLNPGILSGMDFKMSLFHVVLPFLIWDCENLCFQLNVESSCDHILYNFQNNRATCISYRKLGINFSPILVFFTGPDLGDLDSWLCILVVQDSFTVSYNNCCVCI